MCVAGDEVRDTGGGAESDAEMPATAKARASIDSIGD